MREGVYRSSDFGQNWEKRSNHITTSPQYYNEIVVDPKDPNVLYSLDTFSKRSTDGGKTFAKPQQCKPGTWMTTRCGSIQNNTSPHDHGRRWRGL